jgi:hypothetical protein
MGIPFWGGRADDLSAHASAWDVVSIGGVRLPGLCRIDGKKGRRHDKKLVAGGDGSDPSSLGYDPAEFTVTVRMWTDDQLRAFEAMLPTLLPRNGKGNPKPITVSHPALSLFGINALYLMDAMLPKMSSQSGVVEFGFRFSEHSPTAAVGVTHDDKALDGFANVLVSAGAQNFTPAPTQSRPQPLPDDPAASVQSVEP